MSSSSIVCTEEMNGVVIGGLMLSSTNFSSPPTLAKIHCSCDKVYHKQEARILLFILGQIVT